MGKLIRAAGLLALLVFLSPWSWASEPYRIGFAQDTLGNDWRLAQVREVEQELDKYPQVEFIVTDAEGETSLQAQHIEELVARGVDVLMTSPRDQVVLSSVIEKVHQQGIPVILLSRAIAGDGYTSLVTSDNRAIARSAAEHLVQELEGQGHILMLEGVEGASTTEERSEGFMQTLQNHPDIRVTRRTANFLRADAILAVSGLLTEGVKPDAIYAQSDSMATGARMALQQAGIDPASLPLVGIDFISEARDAIRAGEQSASFTYQTGGKEGARLAMQLLKGEEVPRKLVLDSVKVTSENVDQVEPIF
ncbi:substrate-binding domain-containing protein [Marinospirillum sp.]|uniref:substrate-binding domain-containing protein n=1 Tax=Marinospirillum sp. TaxID=2183934 RepID=UPI00385168EA